MAAATALSTPEDANSPARRTVSREDLLAAALKLIGPHRSLSTLSLREVAREAGIAPNSYRQFRDMDELAVALIDAAGRSLRTIIGEARQRATSTATSVVRVSVETFMEQLRADDKLLHVLLREARSARTTSSTRRTRAALFRGRAAARPGAPGCTGWRGPAHAGTGGQGHHPAGVRDGRHRHGPAAGSGTGRADLHDDPHDHRRRPYPRRVRGRRRRILSQESSAPSLRTATQTT
jgi:AcrR family transcriptional regulator